MTSLGAVLSLRNTINNILHCSRFNLIGGSQQIIQAVYNELEPWQEILERLDKTSPSLSRKKVNALDGRIKEVIWKFEDSLESLLIQHINPSQLETLPERVLSMDLQSLKNKVHSFFQTLKYMLESLLTENIPSQLETLAMRVSIDLQSLQSEVHSLIETLKVMEKEYIYEVENMPQDEAISSSIGFHGANTKMIGLSDQFHELKNNLMRRHYDPRIKFHAIIGTSGVGKTTLAMQIYQDPEIQSMFKCCAWVTVGRVPQPISQILKGILAQLCGITQGDEEIEDDKLKERLHGKNCLIVLDDVWETDAWNCMEHSFSRIRNGCIHFLFTGRHRRMINDNVFINSWYKVRFLNEEESMELLCEKVFGDEICPPQLHKVAAKIAKVCEGLPLLIITVARMISLSEHNRDPTYWNEVAERRNSVFKDAYDEISKVLFPSYDYLPQNLKMPFLFMGVFPRDYDNPPSKIITMLTSEGLLYWQEVEIRRHEWGNTCLRELAFNYSLLLCSIKGVDKTSRYVLTYKTCRLHSSWQHVCRREASKNKFYHVLNTLNDASGESLKGQRGLCVENNILFGIKEFRDSVRLNCASFARSLLFYGPYHQYPISIDVGFMLLREIDALTQRFYTFPIEILSLVQLKYLALTCNGEVPSTISKLFNLRVLIIHPHMKIRRRGAPSYVPMEIWNMKELEHIEILGKSLVAPSHVVSLEKLSTLVGVNASICTISKVSKRIPNIKKLGIQIEVKPYEDCNDLLSCFDNISSLECLVTLKLSITNPVIKKGRVFPVRSLKLPVNLKKLHLSGMGFPWEYMNDIASLPNLEALKLRSYAFQGSHWNAKDYCFPHLKFLLIEESDLVQWESRYGVFSELMYISLKHCYKLENISIQSLFRSRILEIELEDCNYLVLTWASQLPLHSGATLRVTSTSSFDEKPTTIKFERYGDLAVRRSYRWW
ncbi:putative late blight resistance protein homolog R1A-10 [Salvia hispanica]|uniref:putative late blight resistance protein homolog R1A-10 n=1 Tax=Salvia hispanica TaxID=49212 RepID=UPI00200992F3|nr:putative late blight resistance protein homolog R1A-10 [Salvia hispanica]XP_047962704.1 putative late blight resistance protein homolog R1A-10 [Salvia hispanica]XP_047962709.1 putative late blight resistance protein homolog R1A-10 [Salvia hispanica]XP_047962717.1 putative late blight resistance protein homolog R1A-10 [Salvia hispanica]XP_047962724.1 putative late blight resistance protein homolog R1A-10 [Salvia hispanica]XP_047962732.1 putative late blight resistance protein homolog R1A-10 